MSNPPVKMGYISMPDEILSANVGGTTARGCAESELLDLGFRISDFRCRVRVVFGTHHACDMCHEQMSIKQGMITRHTWISTRFLTPDS